MDSVTILTSKNNLVKHWVTSSHIETFTGGKYFRVQEVGVDSLNSLAAVLEGLQHRPSSAIVRGKWKGEEAAQVEDSSTPAGWTRRNMSLFSDTRHHWMMIDVDNFVPAGVRPYIETERAACQFIELHLPEHFKDVNFYWQLSNSAGKDLAVLKIHLWFWIRTSYTSGQLKEWSERYPALDASLFNPIQLHFTGSPLFSPCVPDPVVYRNGHYSKNTLDEVDLVIQAGGTSTSARALRIESIKSSDAVARQLQERGMVLSTRPDGGLHIRCPFAHEHTIESAESSTIYFLPHTGGFENGMFNCLHSHCAKRSQYDFLNVLGIQDGTTNDNSEGSSDGGEGEDTEKAGKVGKKKRIAATREKLNIALCYPEKYGFQIIYDSFSESMKIRALRDKEYVRFQDSHYEQIAIALERSEFKPIPQQTLVRAVGYFARQNLYDSAKAWIAEQTWDGTNRIDKFIPMFFGAEDNDYTRAIGAYLWTALAGRVIDPGVQADMVPISIGRQGAKKSRAVAAIAPFPDWFRKIDLSEKDADLIRTITGAVIVELDEMRGVSTRDIEHIKSFITKTHDVHVPKYVEHPVTYFRRAIFFGTANRDELLLKDSTGNRRWLPFSAFRDCKPEHIAELRGQLWAEGKIRYKERGVQWQRAEELAPAEHAKYTEHDIWEDNLIKWLDREDEPGISNWSRAFTTTELLSCALGVEPRYFSVSHKQRIAMLMKSLGFSKVRRLINKSYQKVYVLKPSPDEKVILE